MGIRSNPYLRVDLRSFGGCTRGRVRLLPDSSCVEVSRLHPNNPNSIRICWRLSFDVRVRARGCLRLSHHVRAGAREEFSNQYARAREHEACAPGLPNIGDTSD